METYERRTNKTTMNDLANEVRSYMEQNNQTNQTILSQMEKSNQALLQALQDMGNSINNLRGRPKRETSFTHSKNNNVFSTTGIPQPSFLHRAKLPREEEGIEQPMIRTEDIARAYAALEPNIREVTSFKKNCDDK